jgi:UDPglucose 6-dehydrogenase
MITAHKVALSLAFLINFSILGKNIVTIVGTGYVGLVSGACLAELGSQVICSDIDQEKIEKLNNGIMPIYEPGLAELVARNVDAQRLSFTSDVEQAIRDASVIFIAVGTPMGDDGRADLRYVYSVVKMIANNVNNHKIIVTKSTVPVGTGKSIRTILEQEFNIDHNSFNIVSNPEFLREGVAINDFLNPDRLVIGIESDHELSDYTLMVLCNIYEPLIDKGVNYVFTSLETSEISKYASNGFLSVKISFTNEMANLCDEVGADISTVTLIMGLDHRISPYFLCPGPGFGGSCFPKDSQALSYIAQQHGLPFHTIDAALTANDIQHKKPFQKLSNLLMHNLGETVKDKKIAVLGLAFKANTDDIRYSPAITTINLLLEHGATVKAYDPIAMPNMKHVFPDITYGKNPYDTVTDADAIVIITDWDEIKQLNFEKVKNLAHSPIIVDSRNCINPMTLRNLGFICDTIGKSYLFKKYAEHVKLIPIQLKKRKLFVKLHEDA